MSRIAYVDGQYLPHRSAGGAYRGSRLSVRRRRLRGASRCVGGRLLDEGLHLARLHALARRIADCSADVGCRAADRAARGGSAATASPTASSICRSRAASAPRDHGFPKSAKPALVVTARRKKPADPRLANDGIAVITIPDIRWRRCDIKSVALVANVLGKERAREAGAYEAWQVDSGGYVTEGTSTNAWIVTADGAVGHPPGRQCDPQRRHPAGRVRHHRAPGLPPGRAAVLPWPRPRRRAKRS